MHRAAGDLDPGLQRLGLRIQAFEGRQQRGMDVELTPIPFAHKARALDAHEAGQGDELDASLGQDLIEGGVEGLARGISLMLDQRRRQPLGAGPGETRRVRTVCENDGHFGGIAWRARRRHQRHHVGAAARDQDGEALFRHHAAHANRPVKRTASASPLPLAGAFTPRPGSTLPIRTGSYPAAVKRAITSASALGATTATMPMPQLKVRNISAASSLPTCCSQPNTAGACQAPRSTWAAAPAGRMRGKFSLRPPPVMCASPLIARVSRMALSTPLT